MPVLVSLVSLSSLRSLVSGLLPNPLPAYRCLSTLLHSLLHTTAQLHDVWVWRQGHHQPDDARTGVRGCVGRGSYLTKQAWEATRALCSRSRCCCANLIGQCCSARMQRLSLHALLSVLHTCRQAAGDFAPRRFASHIRSLPVVANFALAFLSLPQASGWRRCPTPHKSTTTCRPRSGTQTCVCLPACVHAYNCCCRPLCRAALATVRAALLICALNCR